MFQIAFIQSDYTLIKEEGYTCIKLYIEDTSMNRNYFIVAIITLLLVLPWSITFGDEGEHSILKWKPGISPVTNAVYKDECGSCHFAYQPGLLPARSWEKIMSSLASHFGDNAELSSHNHQQILSYLTANSADKVNDRRSKKIVRSIAPNDTPVRITDTPYIRRKHDEIPSRLITGNDKVTSLSRCEACHQTADKGFYNESQIRIPGVGRWDD